MTEESDTARILALPCWQGKPSVAPLSGGLSNANYVVTDGAGRHVVRFGKDYPFHHVSRAREVMTARAAHAAGFGPAVEYAAEGVMVTQFLGAKTYAAADVCANPQAIGRLLRQFHTRMPEGITGAGFMFWVFHVIRDYAHTLKAADAPCTADLPQWLAQSRAFEAVQVSLPVIFGHNDLLPANILDDGKRLWLIDYEYAGFNTALFDLAGVASNAGMDQAQSNMLLHAYFGAEPAPALWRAYDAMLCASLLRELLWAHVSNRFLSAPGVDYSAYAAENLARYRASIDSYQSRHGILRT